MYKFALSLSEFTGFDKHHLHFLCEDNADH